MRFARTPGNVFFQMYSCQSLDKVLQHATICNLLASVGTFSRWNCPGAHAAHCQDIRVMVRAFTFRGFPIVDGELFAPHPDLVNHGGTWKMS